MGPRAALLMGNTETVILHFIQTNKEKMKVVVELGAGVPPHVQDVDRTTSILEIKKNISSSQGIILDDFNLYLLANELKDSKTIGDITLGDTDEVKLRADMDPRSGVFARNLGSMKWLIHGRDTSFEVDTLETEQGINIKTNKFGIVASHTEKDDNKKQYTADMYEANANFWNTEAAQVEITEDGNIIKKNADGTKKKLARIDTVEYDETNKNSSEDDDSDDLLNVMKILQKAADYIKAATKPK